MKRKIILRLSYLVAFLTVFWSCHNEDFANGNVEPQRNNANFFLHSTKGRASARGSVDYVAILEAYNDEKDFLSTMPDQQGMPVWNKMQILDAGKKTVLYVPLSADNAGLSSLLIVKVDEKDSVFEVRNFTNDYLEAYVYNTDYPAVQRKLLMDAFLQMDFFTFGHQEFTNLPKDIYKGSSEYNRLNIPEVKIEAEQNKGFVYNTVCTTYHYCVNGHGTSSCDYGNCTCGGFISCFVVTSCTTTATWIDDPFPSFPGSHGGGGGGGTPVDYPKDPCTQAKVFYRVRPGCLGSGGDAGLNGLDNPCQKLKSLLNPAKANLKPLITGGMYDYINNSSTGEGGIYLKKDASGNITSELAPYTAGNTVYIKSGGLYYSAMHTHPNTTYPMFSWTDIYNLYLLEMNAALPFNRGASSFLLVCEDVNGVKQTYAIVFEDIGTMIEDVLNDPFNSGLTSEQICAKMDDELKIYYDQELTNGTKNYERAFLRFNLGTNISLYKANDSLTNWSKLSINENTDIAIVTSINCN